MPLWVGWSQGRSQAIVAIQRREPFLTRDASAPYDADESPAFANATVGKPAIAGLVRRPGSRLVADLSLGA